MRGVSGDCASRQLKGTLCASVCQVDGNDHRHTDRYTQDERESLRQSLLRHSAGLVDPRNVVSAAADPAVQQVVRVDEAGNEIESERRTPPDVAAVDRKGLRRVTALNEDLLAHRALGEVEEIRYESSHDGREIQGWIVKPPGFDPARSGETPALFRRGVAMAVLAGVLWLGVFGPLGTLGTQIEPDFSRMHASQLFLLHGLFAVTLAVWYVLGFAGTGGSWTAQLGFRVRKALPELGIGAVAAAFVVLLPLREVPLPKREPARREDSIAEPEDGSEGLTVEPA